MDYDLNQFGLSKEELFAKVDHSDLESEKITAPDIPIGIPCSACFLRISSIL